VTDTHVFVPAGRMPALPAVSLRLRRLALGDRVLFDPVAQGRPAMRAGEVALLATIVERAHRYLEFGAGGSTIFALRAGAGAIVSVESDVAWIARLHAEPLAAEAILEKRLHLLHADIGETGDLGRPASADSRARWPNYAGAPWPHVHAERLDAVLIDGRFRIACILETALRCGPQTQILVHDFWNRPEYHGVLAFLNAGARQDSLGVFTVKPDFDREAATAMRAAHAFDPR
jgi:hypothetical protein